MADQYPPDDRVCVPKLAYAAVHALANSPLSKLSSEYSHSEAESSWSMLFVC